MTKKHFVIIISFLSVCLCLLFGVKYYLDNNSKEIDIKALLSTEAYSYLPIQAQEYIERVFALTGEVVLTEKNKQPKEYYLNPEFVEYLVAEDQEIYEAIPEEQIVDYYFTGAEATTNLPATFDLRNVSGKNFVTPQKSQGSYGLCWSFATMEQAESLLLVKSNKSYSSSSKTFSSRHADYATAKDGVVDLLSPYRVTSRNLTEGGYFTYIAPYAMDGLSYVPENWITYTSSATQLDFNKVFNYANSDLELNSSINMPSVNLDSVEAVARTEYLNRVKEAIMTYGGAYVATSSPQGNCSIKKGSYRLIYKDGSCSAGAHAMQIIGWDDNYSYSICTKIKNNSNENAISSDVTNCKGTVVNGTGAWMLRNSWGTNNPIVYLAYDSRGTTINVATDISERNWDNNYHHQGEYIINQNKNVKKKYTKLFNQAEKLVKIKIQLQTQAATYSVYLGTGENSNNNTLLGTIFSDLPGIYTLDVSSKNIILTDKTFTINVTSTDGMLSQSYLSVYTSNVNNTPEIQTKNYTYLNDFSNSDNYVFRIESDVTGIAGNTKITYKIFDSSNKEITSPFTYTENIVAAGKLYTKFSIDGSLSRGVYTLKSYNGSSLMSTSELNIKQPLTTIEGSGTKADPYLVGTPAQLDLIRNNNTAYYKLINDIDMTYDTQNPEGLFYNDGLGWEPLYSGSLKISSNKVQEISPAFQGGLDGNGHKIIGLFINRPNEDYVGLFSGMYNKNYADLYVKNLTLENPNITGRNYVGGIVGVAGQYNISYCLTLKDLAVNMGRIQGNNYVAGIAGYVEGGGTNTGTCVASGEKRFEVSSLYNSTNVIGHDYVAGIIGYLTNLRNSTSASSHITIHDIQNIGHIVAEDDASGLFGVISVIQGVAVNVNNAISSGKLTGNDENGIFSLFDRTVNSSIVNMNNIYYTSENGYYSDNGISLSDTGIHKVSVSDLTTMSLWSGFDSYWVRKTISNKPRIPILAIMKDDFEYTSINTSSLTIDLDNNEQKYIFDYILPSNSLAKYATFVIDNDKISINKDGMISGNKKGSSIINISSSYDGFTGKITVDVIRSPFVIFHSNFDDNVINQSIVNGYGVLYHNSFERPGYRFIKWNTQADGKGINYEDEAEINIEDDLNLYAQWEREQYTINFITNGGSPISALHPYYGDIITTSTLIPNLPGYNFAGWYKDSGFNTLYDETKPVTGNMTLYAKWEGKEYDISFALDGGYLSTNTVRVKYMSKYYNLLPTPTKENKRFDGWYKDQDRTVKVTENDVYSYMDNIILYAGWKDIVYDIKFETNGGTIIPDKHILQGQTIPLNTINIQRNGYDFDKWYIDSDLKTPYDNTKPVTQDWTLYAGWKEKSYNITFSLDGGSISNDKVVVKYNSTYYNLLPVPIKDRYLFKGWYKDPNKTQLVQETDIYSYTSDIMLYASWEFINISTSDLTEYELTQDVLKIEENTNVSSFSTNPGYTYKIYDINNNEKTSGLIATSDRVDFYYGNNKVLSHSLAIWGDIDGDGIITARDYKYIKKHVMGTREITGVYKTAADIDTDTIITARDYRNIKRYVMRGHF